MLKIGTLFSGIGSPEEALKQMKIDYQIAFACDIDDRAKETYLNNFKCDNFYSDIKDIPDDIDEIDLLIFGFPCQPFSTASSTCEGLKDPRGKLIFEAVRILNSSNPKYFIAENVSNLVKMDEGKTFSKVIKLFKKSGYKIQHKILNSLDYGVPQHRNRLYIVGIRNDVKQKFSFDIIRKYRQKRYRDILDKKVEKRFFATKDFLSKNKVQNRIENYNKAYAPCLTKTIARNGSSSEYISQVAAVFNAIGQYRKPTPRECARLHGFSESFHLSDNVPVTSQYEQFANTITVNVMKNILKKILGNKNE